MIGRFAFSKAGHDKKQLYLIVAEQEDFVYLCDGRLKTIENPKKKRKKHIQPTTVTVEQSLLERLIQKETVRNEEIKYALKHYSEGKPQEHVNL